MSEPAYLPRPGDLPREALITMARKVCADSGGPARCDIFFKFTCMWCGTRCTLSVPNTLFEIGECCQCGKSTKIDAGGLSVHFKI